VDRGAGGGPTIEIGSPSLKDGRVLVPIEARGDGFSPYVGINVHLRWAPGVFHFGAVDATGGPFDGGHGLCASATAGDGDRGGVAVGCSLFGSQVTVGSAGLNFMIALVPAADGCSPLHLVTYGAPDGGDSSTGTYTLENESTYQVNQYRDGAADVRGEPCQPSGEEAARAIAPTPGSTVAGGAGAASPTLSSGNIAGAITPARSESRSEGHTVLFAGIAAALVAIAAAAIADHQCSDLG
jgi:hypothetical protein